MNAVMKSVIAAIAFGVAVNAFAVEKDITVNATVDSTLDMTLSDGQPLPSSVEMQYTPGVGLAPTTLETKIWSNDAGKDIKASLAATPVLNNTTGSGTVALAVKLGTQAITPAPSTLDSATLFPTGEVDQGSVTLPLEIIQATTEPLNSGNYTGMVSLVLTQATE
ncbi:CS1 type fimbrial major subunit [Scandinavium sp. V105_16]|uniref:CS1 type fimbrial major subunit n=1 Tax=Scandinavium lactucae TaxID=3095028 RepID=A0AAJ2S6Q0_9ENTR|nr:MULTISPECIES: CS1 type fimbrial major subunit [unclassified Scandinavium]MDX6020842.1 CS1 type fimbrial major subunit [Scandinavium sp. V105_16]MDX6030936.1 CS1 type fimbrial major subunit [Scandinavium sp. V105_12]